MSEDRLVPAHHTKGYVSDTPETDAVEDFCINLGSNAEINGRLLDHARMLERRINRIVEYCQYILQLNQ